MVACREDYVGWCRKMLEVGSHAQEGQHYLVCRDDLIELCKTYLEVKEDEEDNVGQDSGENH